jgi:hypothetical protein
MALTLPAISLGTTSKVRYRTGTGGHHPRLGCGDLICPRDNLRQNMTRQTFADELALRILAHDKLPAIWELHLAAARAYSNGQANVAGMLIEIAEAAEREWLRRCEGEAAPAPG